MPDSLSHQRRLPLIALVLVSLSLFVFAPDVRAQGPSVPTVQAPEEKSSAKKEEVTIQTRAARGQAPLVHLYDSLKFESSRIYHLPALKAEQMKRDSKKRVRVGEVRVIERPLKSLSDSTTYAVPEGEVHLMGIISEGAVYTRIHFTKMSLPKGARVFVYSAKNPEDFSGPYTDHGASEKGDFWTPPMEGDRVVVEYFLPKSATAAKEEAFQISEVGHIFTDPFYKAAAGSCNLDVTPDWSNVAKSVGHLQFADGGSFFVCTGTLLNDQAQDFTPYLLTANHCIDNQQSAQSLSVYWLYNSGNDPPPGTPRTDGATLLATGTASDFTLLRLTGTLPAGLVFSGWDASTTPVSTPVTGIHHPKGSYKRISFGTTITSCASGLPGPCQNFTPVRWNSGTTEGGSSGSGLWKGSPSDPRLVGTLTGGEALCSNLNGTDYYGSFSVTYQSIASYLTNGTPPSAPANNNFVSAQVITGCTGSVTGTNTGANKETGEPSHSDGNAGGASVWYQWQSPSTSSVTINTSGSSYDTLLAVYTGNSVGGLTAIAKNDDSTGVTSSVTFNATAGTTYRIAVDGFSGATGNITLNWTAQNCTATPTCTYSISPSSLLFNAGGGSGSTVSVTAGAGCAWTATSNSSFITITGGSSGSGSGTVTYSVAANTSTSQRTGTMTIAGQTFTVTQNGAAQSVSTLQLAQNSYNVTESTGSIAILVNRSGDLSSAVSVNYATSDASNFLQNCNVVNGQATSRCDYVNVVGTLHFASGENSKTLFVPVVDDRYLEGSESFFMTLSSPTGGAVIGANQTATIAITDNGNDGAGQPNPIDGTNFFVRQHYIDFLGREPDPASIGWNNQINNCVPVQPSCDRLSVSQGIYSSPEFKDRGFFIYKFFATAFGRKPGYDEFVLDRARVSGFQTDTELAQSKLDFITDFMNRAEFHTIYDSQGTNRSFVETILARAQISNYANKENLIQSMDGGFITRAGALRAIAESAEADSRFLVEATIVMHYFGYLRRDPDAAYQDWINIFNQTGDSRNVTNGFVNSLEYRNRFGQ
ncbi:MAG TPA: Calx-beta domain-containing protein [Pyrinomonadaceae bacterium]|jgi:hypothetical protein|nr:Calx-beta domain-containing protein [Pyrinomonadaceae bacterium]